jgi:magnesium chelatase family protein
LSGPLLDRIDLLVCMERTAINHLSGRPATSSSYAREQVIEARERQAVRLRDDGILVNAQMDARMLRRHVKLDERGEKMLARSQERRLLSARGQHRALRVARTIADLDHSKRVSIDHLSQAFSLRAEVGFSSRRAA